jgi:hypothetical protein
MGNLALFRAGVQDVIVVAGQSNAGDGNSLGFSDLPSPLNGSPDQSVLIWNGSEFVVMQNGVNTDPITASSPTGAATWGPHVEFAYRWRLDNPLKPLYIIHGAVGGTGLDASFTPSSWCPPSVEYTGTRLFDGVTTLISNAKAQLVQPKVRAVLWMQGEADANGDLALAERYATNLPPLLSAMLSFWGDDQTKILVGRIDNGGVENQTGGVWHNAPPVQAAQDAVNGSLGGLVRTINTTSYSTQSGASFHYDGNGQVSLGGDMYDAYLVP